MWILQGREMDNIIRKEQKRGLEQSGVRKGLSRMREKVHVERGSLLRT